MQVGNRKIEYIKADVSGVGLRAPRCNEEFMPAWTSSSVLIFTSVLERKRE
jgi:hypothetical protein